MILCISVISVVMSPLFISDFEREVKSGTDSGGSRCIFWKSAGNQAVIFQHESVGIPDRAVGRSGSRFGLYHGSDSGAAKSTGLLCGIFLFHILLSCDASLPDFCF